MVSYFINWVTTFWTLVKSRLQNPDGGPFNPPDSLYYHYVYFVWYNVGWERVGGEGIDEEYEGRGRYSCFQGMSVILCRLATNIPYRIFR